MQHSKDISGMAAQGDWNLKVFWFINEAGYFLLRTSVFRLSALEDSIHTATVSRWAREKVKVERGERTISGVL